MGKHGGGDGRGGIDAFLASLLGGPQSGKMQRVAYQMLFMLGQGFAFAGLRGTQRQPRRFKP